MTWAVFERTLYMTKGGTLFREKQVAICATKEQALDELRRLSSDMRPDEGAPEWESPTYLVKIGVPLIGLVPG